MRIRNLLEINVRESLRSKSTYIRIRMDSADHKYDPSPLGFSCEEIFVDRDVLPKRVSTALAVKNMAISWLSQNHSNELINIFIQGNAFYGYFICKHLALSGVPFKIETKNSQFTDDDFLITKFAELVKAFELLDFSTLNSDSTLSFPNTFLQCSNLACEHSSREYLPSKVTPLKISVVIPTRNVPKQWIENLLKQLQLELQSGDQVILIDDNELALDIEDWLFTFSFLKLVRGRQSGISSARNQGVEASINDLVLFIDSDDEIRPGFISKQRFIHEKYSNISATGTWIQAFGAHKNIYPQWDGFSPLAIFQCLPPAGILMWKREALLDLGVFRDEFSIGFEDFDLVARAVANNHLIIVIDEVLYDYRRGHQSLSQSIAPEKQKLLAEQVWLNSRSLCDANFATFLRLGLEYGKRMYFDSVNYMFFGKKPRKVLFELVLKARSYVWLRKVWMMIPLSLRIKLYRFAITH